MRIRQMQLRPATATEASPAAGQTAVALCISLSNGRAARSGNFTASMVDSDGVAVNGHSTNVYSAYYSLAARRAGRGTIAFGSTAGSRR